MRAFISEINMDSLNHDDCATEYLNPAKRQRSLLLCGHCDAYLSKSTYYRHRELYFNPASLKWTKDRGDYDSSSLVQSTSLLVTSALPGISANRAIPASAQSETGFPTPPESLSFDANEGFEQYIVRS